MMMSSLYISYAFMYSSPSIIILETAQWKGQFPDMF
jgi:hypothetical protein